MIGEHWTTCRTCQKGFMVGDCIHADCPECVCKKEGHLWLKGLFGGPLCGRCGAHSPVDKPRKEAGK